MTGKLDEVKQKQSILCTLMDWIMKSSRVSVSFGNRVTFQQDDLFSRMSKRVVFSSSGLKISDKSINGRLKLGREVIASTFWRKSGFSGAKVSLK